MKSTKKALFMSCLSLLLCVSMLIGTTFAWFTDTVTSGVNQIVAGNLDIELEYSKDMSEGSWKTVQDATKIFDDTALWEPGRTELVYLRFVNKGTLALKYDLRVQKTGEIQGTNQANQTFKLSDYIEYGTVDGVTSAFESREAAVAAATTAPLVSHKISEAFTKSGSLLAETDPLVVAVVVFMPEEVGNVANYKTGTDTPKIKLGIALTATQLNSEVDSFDKEYDKDATTPPNELVTDPDVESIQPVEYDDVNHIATINSADGYREYMNGDKHGYNVKLGADIDFGGELVTTFAVPSLDGNGKKLMNARVVGGFFEEGGAESLKVKNVTFENITVTAAAGDGLGAGVVSRRVRNGETENVTIKNCTIDATAADKAYAGAFCGTLNGTVKNVKVEGCTVIGKNAGGLVGFASAEGVNVLIENCKVENTSVKSTRNENATTGVGAIVGRATKMASDTWNMNGCTFSNVTTTSGENTVTAQAVGDTAATYTVKIDGVDFNQ